MVRLAPGTCDEAELIFSATKTTRSGRRFQWWALVPDERAGREVAKDLSKAAKATGSTLKNPVKVSPKLSDFSNIIEPMLAAKPDGILLWLDPLLAGRLAKSLRGAGFTGKLAGPSRLSSTNFTSSAGIAAEGFLLPSPLLDQASKVVFAQFALDYRRRFGNEPDLAACMAYDAAMLLIDIFRKSSDKPAHRAFPLACQPPGASGSLRFDSTGNRLARLELLEFRSGRFAQFADHNAHK
jgi:ABC-type branched-subunit amino acid transport system substrate-binding protein